MDPEMNDPIMRMDMPCFFMNDDLLLCLLCSNTVLLSLLLSSFLKEDEGNPNRSAPTPSGRKIHHATHATKLNKTVLFIVNAMPICMEHIVATAPYTIPLFPK
jgi:hypothetical protein